MTSDWQRIRLGDLGAVLAGRQRSARITEGSLRPYLRVANVMDGEITLHNVNSMLFTDREFETFRLQPGDILVNEGQSIELVGRCAIYQGEPQNCCFQNTLIRFRPGASCDPNFAFHFFRHLRLSGVFRALSTQTTSIAHLGARRFENLHVVVPGSISEQREIAAALSSCISPLNREIALLERQFELLKQLKQGLLAHFFAHQPTPEEASYE